ncbi:MAG: PilW family protein [Candidatus Methylomirabilia bacterium]
MTATRATGRAPEAGFTLTEMLLVTAVLGLVLAAVLGVYQVSLRSYLFTTAGETAQLSGRAVVDRIASEFRLINNSRSVSPGAITAATATTITFLAEINNDTLDAAGADATLTAPANAGDTEAQVSSAAGFSAGELLYVADGAISENQVITGIAGTTLTLGASLDASYPAGSVARSVETVTYTLDGTGTLRRQVGGGGAQPLASGVTAFQITYWTGVTPPVEITDLTTQVNRDRVRELRVTLTSTAQSGDQTVSRTFRASVRPRNLL